MWKLEIERLELIHNAIGKEKVRVENELTARAFFAIRIRETHLYIVYLKDRKPGPYTIKEPCLWPKLDKEPLISLLQVAARFPAAQAVYLRVLLVGKDREGTIIFPVGRFDISLARRLATPLPKGHPALSKKKIKLVPPIVFYEEIENDHG